MRRRVRHIHADKDEYIHVHRKRPSSGGDDGDFGCFALILLLVVIIFFF